MGDDDVIVTLDDPVGWERLALIQDIRAARDAGQLRWHEGRAQSNGAPADLLERMCRHRDLLEHALTFDASERRAAPGVPDGTDRSDHDGDDQLRLDVGVPDGTTKVRHGAQFSTEIIAALAVLEPPIIGPVHDPFAGTGQRLGQLCDRLGVTFTGTEIEQTFIVDARVARGDSTDPATYPDGKYTILTSPVYANGMANSWNMRNGRRYNTYRYWVMQNEGSQRELHVNNQGRYSYRNTGAGSQMWREYWRIATAAVDCWTGATRAIVNVKDFERTPRGGSRIIHPHVDEWAKLLERHGWTITQRINVPTPGLRYGANHDARVDHEVILDASPSRTAFPGHAGGVP